MLEQAQRLMQTPRDDWDRRPQKFTVYDEETGEEQALEVNVDNIAFQIDNLMLKRYAAEPQDVVLSHVYRFRMIFRFIEDNLEWLVAEGLIRDEPDAMQVADALIEVLTTARYEATTMEGDEVVHVIRLRSGRGGSQAVTSRFERRIVTCRSFPPITD